MLMVWKQKHAGSSWNSYVSDKIEFSLEIFKNRHFYFNKITFSWHWSDKTNYSRSKIDKKDVAYKIGIGIGFCSKFLELFFRKKKL